MFSLLGEAFYRRGLLSETTLTPSDRMLKVQTVCTIQVRIQDGQYFELTSPPLRHLPC